MVPNKSSINFLLADAKESKDTKETEEHTQPTHHQQQPDEDEDEIVVVVPRTTTKQKKRHIRRPKNPRIALEIIQQPKNAKVSTRASGRVFPPFSEHRPIHPPPVLQLKIEDFKPKHEGALTDDLIGNIKKSQGNKTSERIQELEVIKKMRENRIPPWTHYSTFFVTARLRSSQSEKLLVQNNHTQPTVDDLLIGTNVASGMPLSLRINSSSTNKQLNHLLPIEQHRANNYGIVFVFPDLSVRKVGMFKLKFDLFEVYKGKVFWRNCIYSDDIQIYTPKKFPGSTPSSPLTSFLYRRGARIRQRKRTPSKRNYNEEEEEEDQQDVSAINLPESSAYKYQRTQPLQVSPVYSRPTTSSSSSSSTPFQHKTFNVQPVHQMQVYQHYQQQIHPQYMPYPPPPPPPPQVVHNPYQQSPMMYSTYPFQLPPPARGYYQPMMIPQPYSSHAQTPQLQPLHHTQMSPSVMTLPPPPPPTDDTRSDHP